MRPVTQMPRYRLAAEQIADLIRAGELPPGSKMPPDKDLVDQLGVGRTTVREAMIALELMGYVVTRFGAGAFVADTLPEAPDEASGQPGFFELAEARYRIEPEIAAAAAETAGADDVAHLRACIEAMLAPALPLEIFERHDRDFHVSIARATGNSVFVQVVEEFWRTRQLFPAWTRLDNRRNEADIARFYRDEHSAIADGIADGDAEAARAAMRIHCRNSGQSLLERWRQREEEVPDLKALERVSTWPETGPVRDRTG